MLSQVALLLALAQAPRRPPTATAMSFEDYLSDLTGADAGDRLLAARELRRRVRANARALDSRDELTRLEARQERADHASRTGPACLTVLGDPSLDNAVPACADILGALGDPATRPALEAALAAHPDGRAHRRLARALEVVGP